MEFGINKCATMVVRPDSPLYRYRRDPTFYLAGQQIPIKDCYTYLGIPFDKHLSLTPIMNSLKNKVMKATFSVGGFLRNSRIPLPFKKKVINSFVISKVSYFAPLLGSNKNRTKQSQVLVNMGLKWAAGINKDNKLISIYSLSKDFNIPPLSAKCALRQAKCFNKWKSSNCIISYLVNSQTGVRKHTWVKESKILHDKKLPKRGKNIKEIKDFYWKRDLKKKLVKAEYYDVQKFYKTKDYLNLCYDYPELSLGFQWLMKARCGYRCDASVAKAAKIVTNVCPKYCPCCKKGNQSIEHWCVKCPTFKNVRRPVSEDLRRVLRFFTENSSSNRNNNPNMNDSNSNLPDDEQSTNPSNNNSVSENGIIPTESNINDNANFSVNNNNFYNNSSVFNKVFNFLLGGRSKNYLTREWKDLCKRQVKASTLLDTPFLTVTAALLNNIVPIACGRQRSLFNRFKPNSTKSVNAEITVRQASRASASNEDHNFVS